MNRENKFRIIIISFLGILFVLAWMIFLFFGINYFLLFMLAVFLFFVFIFIELYLRIQHNIDKATGRASSIQKRFYEELLDFFDILLSMQKRMAAGFEDMFNSSYEQTEKLKKDVEDKINLFRKELLEKIKSDRNIKKNK